MEKVSFLSLTALRDSIEKSYNNRDSKKIEEIYFANESTPLYIDKKSESLKLIQKLRDEAHRFSLRQYRNRRDNNFLNLN